VFAPCHMVKNIEYVSELVTASPVIEQSLSPHKGVEKYCAL